MVDGLKRDINVGDEIAYIVGYSGRYRFERAIIVKLTPKKVGIHTIKYRMNNGKYEKAQGMTYLIPKKVLKI